MVFPIPDTSAAASQAHARAASAAPSGPQATLDTPPRAVDSTTKAPPPSTLSQPIPSAAYEIHLTLVTPPADSPLKPFYISTTEVTWDAFDVFVFSLDGTDTESTNPDKPAKDAKPADAVSRPSKPYIPPDRGFGHEGYPAICVSSKSAVEFCRWLSLRSGKAFRLATEDEWEFAARAGADAAAKFPGGDDPAAANDYAWTNANSENTTHPVRSKKPNALGLYDMLGNAREWVLGRDNQSVVKGGGYRDAPEDCTIAARWPYDKAWQVTDPQIPKSAWWLSDGSFIGLRVVCEVPSPTSAIDPTTPNPLSR